jgi:hypothetical protein
MSCCLSPVAGLLFYPFLLGPPRPDRNVFVTLFEVIAVDAHGFGYPDFG